ncbi:MAG: isoprenylcysteine carboxylmethyltransferase family protein [Acidobacteria bacterium]|nr:isoprenylcysteine carboxylmethyltransferase family protein [Acidobacteriota bacterium]
MRPLIFVWPYALLFWAVYVWVFAPEFALVSRAQRTVAENKAKDAGSLQLILIGMQVALLLSFPLAFVRSLRFPASWSLAAFWLGTGLLLAGSLLRRHCWKTLGEHFTGDVQAKAGQPVITRGAYRWVRHPSYTGGILMLAGIGVALASWGSFAILVVAAIVVYGYRVRVEERALVQTIGEPYVAYMKTHKRFVPFVV